MPAKKKAEIEKVEDPPVEPPGVRTDLFEHPDPEALARATVGRGTADFEQLPEDEDPPREHELGLRATRRDNGDSDPPREGDL